jgi:hypothetical protein
MPQPVPYFSYRGLEFLEGTSHRGWEILREWDQAVRAMATIELRGQPQVWHEDYAAAHVWVRITETTLHRAHWDGLIEVIDVDDHWTTT